MFESITELGRALDAMLCKNKSATTCNRVVNAPGIAWNNIQVPGNNLHENSNHIAYSPMQIFNQKHRYAITPENSRSWTRGWMTEKVGNAHRAGQIPIYWGDPLLEEVWNPKRVLVLDDNDGIESLRKPNISFILTAISLLEESKAAQDAFFSEPILAPHAEKWVGQWCNSAERLLRNGHEAFLKRLALENSSTRFYRPEGFGCGSC
jgi:hypothetical protein